MPGRLLWSLEAAYSATGNTVLTSILGNTEDCHPKVGGGARKSSTAGPVVMLAAQLRSPKDIADHYIEV